MILSLHAKGGDEQSRISLFGKVPARADFVRINHGSPASIELDNWLQRNLEELILAGKRFSGIPIQFLFAPERIAQVLIGVLAPSQDKAGRSFPVTVFGALPVDFAVNRLALLPLAYQSFLSELHALITDIPSLEYSRLQERVNTITMPPDEFVEAEEISTNWLKNTEIKRVLKRLFPGDDQSLLYYGVQTFFEAMLDARNPSAEKVKVLECPAESDLDVFLWLEITRRILDWSNRSPSIFWIGPPISKLLLSLGFPPTQLIRDLSTPEHKDSCLLSLIPDESIALTETRKRFGPKLDQLADTATLNDLMSALL